VGTLVVAWDLVVAVEVGVVVEDAGPDEGLTMFS
jgi:hypothetical protein